ncbi:MAG: hypothetical protein R3F43_25075 [bacterium]
MPQALTDALWRWGPRFSPVILTRRTVDAVDTAVRVRRLRGPLRGRPRRGHPWLDLMQLRRGLPRRADLSARPDLWRRVMTTWKTWLATALLAAGAAACDDGGAARPRPRPRPMDPRARAVLAVRVVRVVRWRRGRRGPQVDAAPDAAPPVVDAAPPVIERHATGSGRGGPDAESPGPSFHLLRDQPRRHAAPLGQPGWLRRELRRARRGRRHRQALAESVGQGRQDVARFLSATQGPDGQPVHAIERIGNGPWHDANGRPGGREHRGPAQRRSPRRRRGLGGRPARRAWGAPQHPRRRPRRGDGLQRPGPPVRQQPRLHLHGLDERRRRRGPQRPDVRPLLPPGMGAGGRPGRGGANWLSDHPLRGCSPGVNLIQNGPGTGDCIGCSGGYGALYCFAVSP